MMRDFLLPSPAYLKPITAQQKSVMEEFHYGNRIPFSGEVHDELFGIRVETDLAVVFPE